MKKSTTAALALALCLLTAILSGCRNQPEGWTELEAGRFYYADGAVLTGWQQIDDLTYHFQSDGLMDTGHRQIDGQDYYFDESGVMATGWQRIQNAYYYFRDTGSMVTGWLSLDGTNHYLTPEGPAASGPVEVDGTVYLFGDRGALTSGWVTSMGRRYYGDEFGRPLTGWQEVDGIRCCFGEDYAQQTGWVEDDNFSYYFYTDGNPAQGRVTIEGEAYTFAFNGQHVLLVNPWNYVPEDYAVALQVIGNNHQVAACAAADYMQMMEDCQAAGLSPIVCSSYRTQEYQQGLYDRRSKRDMDDGYSREAATEKAGKSVAIPGTSEHQLGLALDIIDSANRNLDETQADMPAQKWLMEHSWEYGWILRYPNEKSEITGIIYEPWHYRYVGRAVAADIHETGLCLEEYLESLSTSVG